MLGSILTRQYRFATRGIEIGVKTAQQAVDVAGDVVGALAGRFGLGDGNGNGHREPEVFTGEVVPDAEPLPEPPEPQPEPRRAPPSSARSAAPPTAAPPTAAPATAPPPPPASAAPATAAVPPPPAAAPASPPTAPEPVHVSTEPELVEESAEPGAEDGAGATIHVREPWPSYRHLKARDVIARLPTATREELAAVELFELAHANRKSVVLAAQQALKKASPPH